MSDIQFLNDSLSSEEAYWVMWYFLDRQYALTNGEIEMSDILGACQPFEFNENGHFDGQVKGNRIISPADSAMVSDWNEAIKKYRAHGKPKPNSLK